MACLVPNFSRILPQPFIRENPHILAVKQASLKELFCTKYQLQRLHSKLTACIQVSCFSVVFLNVQKTSVQHKTYFFYRKIRTVTDDNRSLLKPCREKEHILLYTAFAGD